ADRSSIAGAELHRGAGEYFLRTRQRQCIDKARDELQRARGQLAQWPSGERDLLLLDVAMTQVDLGGDGDDVTNHIRLPWNAAAEEIKRTLVLINREERL